MLNNKYYDGYEGEERIKIWFEDDNSEEIGFIIWNGFFNTILEGCFYSDFQKNGIIECYYNQNGFYDEIWEMIHPEIVLEELRRFNDNSLDTQNKEISVIVKEVIGQLISLINAAVSKKEKIYIEYE